MSIRFEKPSGVVLDALENVYVTDTVTNQIYKITLDGVVHILAGNGAVGFEDGAGTNAQFNTPISLAVDTLGNVYIADMYNDAIRKITPGGKVSTINIANIVDYERIHLPVGIALDTKGNLYVVDSDEERICKITLNGDVGTLEEIPIRRYYLYTPNSIVLDALDNIYITDIQGHQIYKIIPEGEFSDWELLAGKACQSGFVDGVGSKAQFEIPMGLTLDLDGNIYIADRHNNRIRKITPEGVVSTVAGKECRNHYYDITSDEVIRIDAAKDTIGEKALFDYPNDVAIDASGNLYVADSGKQRICKTTSDGIVIKNW